MSHATSGTPSDRALPDLRAEVRAYHQRTKHQLQRYAAGPDTLDWDAQPDPFRQWAGAPITHLPLVADEVPTRWADTLTPGRVPPWPVALRSLAALLELCLGLTAWKQWGPDRWALRANPSSGNLHPTEGYVLARGLHDLPDGLYHYAPKEHALVCRASASAAAEADPQAGEGVPCVWLGLSSIQWREAWKYGERAFRYCQLDIGHALGAVRYAAAALGWQARVVPGLPHDTLAALLGLDRAQDFGQAEREEPELLIALGPCLDLGVGSGVGSGVSDAALLPGPWPAHTAWHGQASRLDRHPMYRWPVIDQVARATRGSGVGSVTWESLAAPAPVADSGLGSGAQAGPSTSQHTSHPQHDRPQGTPMAASPRVGEKAATLIRSRRSAQHFDKRATMTLPAFARMLAAIMPTSAVPWDAWPGASRVHAVVYAHRVEGLPAGAYVLARSAAGQALMQQTLQPEPHASGPLVPASEGFAGLPLSCLAEHPALAGTLRTLSCHQAIASDACVALSLVAEFDAAIDASPGDYRDLLQEAGLIGQVLYMQAEAEGLRGTGIGCYFDDAVHELLGLTDQRMQVVYHFTVGVPLADSRIATEPPYAHRTAQPDLQPTSWPQQSESGQAHNHTTSKDPP